MVSLSQCPAIEKATTPTLFFWIAAWLLPQANHFPFSFYWHEWLPFSCNPALQKNQWNEFLRGFGQLNRGSVCLIGNWRIQTKLTPTTHIFQKKFPFEWYSKAFSFFFFHRLLISMFVTGQFISRPRRRGTLTTAIFYASQSSMNWMTSSSKSSKSSRFSSGPSHHQEIRGALSRKK